MTSVFNIDVLQLPRHHFQNLIFSARPKPSSTVQFIVLNHLLIVVPDPLVHIFEKQLIIVHMFYTYRDFIASKHLSASVRSPPNDDPPVQGDTSSPSLSLNEGPRGSAPSRWVMTLPRVLVSCFLLRESSHRHQSNGIFSTLSWLETPESSSAITVTVML